MDKVELQKFISDIEKMVSSRAGADLASVIALNSLLTDPKAHELFDDEMKSAVKDLWVSLKTYGVELEEPPFLFGLPDGFGSDNAEEIEKSLETAAASLVEEAEQVAPSVDESEEGSKATPQA